MYELARQRRNQRMKSVYRRDAKYAERRNGFRKNLSHLGALCASAVKFRTVFTKICA
jgi:hypothetical protein